MNPEWKWLHQCKECSKLFLTDSSPPPKLCSKCECDTEKITIGKIQIELL